MRTRAAVPGQRQHLRAKSGERTLVVRDVFLVEDIEVLDQAAVRMLIVTDRLWMAYADTEQRAAGKGGDDAMV